MAVADFRNKMQKPYKCPECDATFARDGNLRAHVRSHGDEEDKEYSCTHCPKKFWTNQHLKKHIEGVHLHIGGKGKTYNVRSSLHCVDYD